MGYEEYLINLGRKYGGSTKRTGTQSATTQTDSVSPKTRSELLQSGVGYLGGRSKLGGFQVVSGGLQEGRDTGASIQSAIEHLTGQFDRQSQEKPTGLITLRDGQEYSRSKLTDTKNRLEAFKGLQGLSGKPKTNDLVSDRVQNRVNSTIEGYSGNELGTSVSSLFKNKKRFN